MRGDEALKTVLFSNWCRVSVIEQEGGITAEVYYAPVFGLHIPKAVELVHRPDP